MISESLKINTTLTELNLASDAKNNENENINRRKRVREVDNEHMTILEQKEPR